MPSCSDDNSYEGELVVTFYNTTTNVALYIYSIDNDIIPIYTSKLKGAKEFKLKLDSGNYIINLVGTSGYASTKIGFQIRLNSRTSIYYDTYDSPSIIDF